jgi:hypothetical protein
MASTLGGTEETAFTEEKAMDQKSYIPSPMGKEMGRYPDP